MCLPAATRATVKLIGDQWWTLLWLECYSSLVALLASKFPGHVGDFMAYQRTIIRASKNFEGTAWAMYDYCFHHHAAAMKSLNWANIDSALYNEAFTGHAGAIPRCHVCLSENHMEAECPEKVVANTRSPWRRPRWQSQLASGSLPATVCEVIILDGANQLP